MSTILRVGPTPDSWRSEATFFDGITPEPRPVQLGIDEPAQALWIDGAGPRLSWPFRDIRHVPDQAGGDIMVLRLKDDPVTRLVLPDQSLASRLPYRHRRAPVTNRGRIAGWAVAALASVALIIFGLVPLMADQLPDSFRLKASGLWAK